MKKLLLSTAVLLPLLVLAPKAFAEDYTYDCLCLYSDPGGACIEYTCDAYSRNARYYNNYDNGCDSRSARYCDAGYTNVRPATYRPTYRNATSVYYNYPTGQYNNNYSSGQYYNNPSSQYYDTRYNYDWYYRRYTGRTSNYYESSYYNTPYYY